MQQLAESKTNFFDTKAFKFIVNRMVPFCIRVYKNVVIAYKNENGEKNLVITLGNKRFVRFKNENGQSKFLFDNNSEIIEIE